MKIQTKTGLIFTIITASTILIVSWAVYYFASSFTNRDFLKRLELRAVIAHKMLFEKSKTSVATYQKVRQEYLEFLPHEKEYVIRTDTLARAVAVLNPRIVPKSFLLNVIKQNGKTVYYRHGITDFAGQFYRESSGDYIILKSAINDYGNETLRHLRNTLTIAFVLSVLIVYTSGIFFSRKTFEPVREIILKAKNISAFNMGLRIEEKEGTDEVAELAKTFNNMLDRIQTAFETQNNFISNASHELRTPLTTIIGEADWALAKDRPVQDYRQSMMAILKQAEHLQNLTTRLLKLAQTTFDGKKQEWELIHADELVNEAISTVVSMSRDNNFNLNMDTLPENESDTLIKGNKTLLQLALVNIISNASKYSNHAPVEVEMIFYDQVIKIIIKDRGIGIPADEVKRVFEPFFRASNVGAYEGYGVGLPLSMSIIRMHHGHIEVYSSENKGTTVICTLPVYRGVE
jgi:signal transduction histidine kinase